MWNEAVVARDLRVLAYLLIHHSGCWQIVYPLPLIERYFRHVYDNRHLVQAHAVNSIPRCISIQKISYNRRHLRTGCHILEPPIGECGQSNVYGR
jgi:hypothetical protein